MSSSENITKDIWKHPATGVILWFTAAAFCAWAWLHTPLPGTAIAVLGAAAVVMSTREMSHRERVLWVFIAFVLLFLELRSIRIDRAVDDEKQKVARAEERQGFERILKEERDSFTDVLNKQTQGFSNVVRLGQHNFLGIVKQSTEAQQNNIEGFSNLIRAL